MNSKGQMGVGTIVLLAVTVIVGLVLLSGSGGIAGQSARLTSQSAIINETFTLAAVGSYTDRPNCVNYDSSSTSVLINHTGGEVIDTANYTFSTRVSPTTGLKVLTVQTDTGANYASEGVNASYNCMPQGYAEDATTRNIVPLIVIFCALAIAVIALASAMKNRIWE